MSETQWGDEGAETPQKKAIPTWLWFCGGGCLLAVVLAIVVGAFVFMKVKEATDPEKQWPKLEQILPLDERPQELTLQIGNDTFGADFFWLQDSRGFSEMLWRFGESKSKEVRSTLLNPDFKGGALGVGERKNLKAGTIHVQGRELETLRFDQLENEPDESGAGVTVKAGKGPSILVDLTPEGSSRPVVLMMLRNKTDDPITDDEVRAFLKPFHVGPER